MLFFILLSIFIVFNSHIFPQQYELTVVESSHADSHVPARFVEVNSAMCLMFNKRQAQKKDAQSEEAPYWVNIGSKGVQQLYEQMLLTKTDVFVQLQRIKKDSKVADDEPSLHKCCVAYDCFNDINTCWQALRNRVFLSTENVDDNVEQILQFSKNHTTLLPVKDADIFIKTIDHKILEMTLHCLYGGKLTAYTLSDTAMRRFVTEGSTIPMNLKKMPFHAKEFYIALKGWDFVCHIKLDKEQCQLIVESNEVYVKEQKEKEEEQKREQEENRKKGTKNAMFFVDHPSSLGGKIDVANWALTKQDEQWILMNGDNNIIVFLTFDNAKHIVAATHIFYLCIDKLFYEITKVGDRILLPAEQNQNKSLENSSSTQPIYQKLFSILSGISSFASRPVSLVSTVAFLFVLLNYNGLKNLAMIIFKNLIN